MITCESIESPITPTSSKISCADLNDSTSDSLSFRVELKL